MEDDKNKLNKNEDVIIKEFYNKLIKDQEKLPEEFYKILDDNFWDLIVKYKKENKNN